MPLKPDVAAVQSRGSLLDYAQRIERDLRDNILPFWNARAVASTGPRFIGAMTNDLVVDPEAERGVLLTARILWTYAAAFRRYREDAYRVMADLAYAELKGRFHDPVHGGFWWSIGADSAVTRDRKQIYAQAFALYALAEYHAATKHPAALRDAITVFELIESHARDREHGGYFEAFDAGWAPIDDVRLSEVDLNEPKSQNTHLHLLEAYTALLRVWPEARLRTALADLVDLMSTRIVVSRGHLGLFFAREWSLRSDRISYGHDIEASWLLTAASKALTDPTRAQRTRALTLELAEITLCEGVDTDGGVFNQGSPIGTTDDRKEWWPQAEAVVGFLNAYQLSRDERFLDAALRTWDFIETRLIDRKHGEWFRGVTRDGRVLDAELKVSFWKCPYHNGRAALEAVRRLRELARN